METKTFKSGTSSVNPISQSSVEVRIWAIQRSLQVLCDTHKEQILGDFKSWNNQTENIAISVANVLVSTTETDFTNLFYELNEFVQTVDIYTFCEDFKNFVLRIEKGKIVSNDLLGLIFDTIFKLYTDGMLVGVNPNNRTVLVEDCIDVLDLEAYIVCAMYDEGPFKLDHTEQFVIDRLNDIKRYTEIRNHVELKEDLEQMKIFPDNFNIINTFCITALTKTLITNLFVELDDINYPTFNLLSNYFTGLANLDLLIEDTLDIRESAEFALLYSFGNNKDLGIDFKKRKYVVDEVGVKLNVDYESLQYNVSEVIIREYHREGNHYLVITSISKYCETFVTIIDLEEARRFNNYLVSLIACEGVLIALTWLGILDGLNVTCASEQQRKPHHLDYLDNPFKSLNDMVRENVYSSNSTFIMGDQERVGKDLPLNIVARVEAIDEEEEQSLEYTIEDLQLNVPKGYRISYVSRELQEGYNIR